MKPSHEINPRWKKTLDFLFGPPEPEIHVRVTPVNEDLVLIHTRQDGQAHERTTRVTVFTERQIDIIDAMKDDSIPVENMGLL